MTDLIVLPGIGGSGAQHWQTLWEEQDPTMRRFAPADWDRPNLDNWIEALDAAVVASPAPPVLVAHSLACLLVAHWHAACARPVRGAFLVAVPNPAADSFPTAAAGFAGAPDRRFGFPSLIIASSNDPYGSPAYVEARARSWGSGLVNVGAHGHLNAHSGLGSWPEGRALLTAFAAGTGLPRSTALA